MTAVISRVFIASFAGFSAAATYHRYSSSSSRSISPILQGSDFSAVQVKGLFVAPAKTFSSVTNLSSLKAALDNMHSEITKTDLLSVSITTIPATQDNFMYLIVDKATGDAAAVDPVEPERVIQVANSENATIKAVLTTHHHWDHAGGNAKMVELYAKQTGNTLQVYGGDSRVEAVTKEVGQGDKIEIGGLQIDCIHTPCHTTGHICYYLNSADANSSPAVFTGDTLFISGCGKFFEGTPPQMYEALIDKLGALPDNTLVFCGHEYTVSNLKFGLSVEANNADTKEKLIWAEAQRQKRQPTVPSTIAEEKLYNPFMRVNVASVQKLVGVSDGISCMGQLRTTKNNFRG